MHLNVRDVELVVTAVNCVDYINACTYTAIVAN